MSQTVRPVVTSGTVAAGGVLISAVNGTAFLDVDTSKTGGADFSTALLAAVANNDVIEITSVTNKQKIIGFAKAAGSGETLGSELITGWTNSPPLPYDTLTVNVNGHDIDSIINTTNYGIGYTNQNASAGQLHKIVADITLNSGKAPRLRAGISGSVGTYIKDGLIDGTYYHTFVDTENQIHLSNQNTATNFSLLISQKQVTAPSAAGITITNSPNGATYNFGLKPVNVNTFYNDSSGYTYRIISRHQYGALIAALSAADADTTIVLTAGSAACDLSADLSGYVGASGATKYILILEDTSGKIARGHIGEVISGTNMKLYSARNGSTQNWEIIESGFDADSDPMKARIYRDL